MSPPFLFPSGAQTVSVKAVADLLAVAREGYAAGLEAKDAKLQKDALNVAALALGHKDAQVFFDGVVIALSELPFGNDPTMDNDGHWDLPDDAPEAPPDEGDQDQGAPGEADEDDNAASPAYEGIVDGDDPQQNMQDGSEGQPKNGPDVNKRGGITERGALEIVANNFQRLNRARMNLKAISMVAPSGNIVQSKGKRPITEERKQDDDRYAALKRALNDDKRRKTTLTLPKIGGKWGEKSGDEIKWWGHPYSRKGPLGKPVGPHPTREAAMRAGLTAQPKAHRVVTGHGNFGPDFKIESHKSYDIRHLND